MCLVSVLNYFTKKRQRLFELLNFGIVGIGGFLNFGISGIAGIVGFLNSGISGIARIARIVGFQNFGIARIARIVDFLELPELPELLDF
jgi:hypothetical protein